MRSARIADDPCSLSRRWILDPTLARMLVALEDRATRIFSAEGLRWPGLYIISGHRSKRRQLAVNPSAPNSRHTLCPSMAADLRVGDLPASTTPDFWRFLGTLWKAMGGRWGGDFKPQPDPNHFEGITIPFTGEVNVRAGPRRALEPPPV